MENPRVLAQECKDRFQEYKDKDPILVKVYEILDVIQGQKFGDWSVEELSRMAGEISMLMVNLGDLLHWETMNASNIETYRKEQFLTELLKLKKEGGTVAEAEARAELVISKIKQEEIEAQYIADMLKTLYRGLDRIVSVIQSRMKSYDIEKCNTNLSDNVTNE